MAAALPRVPPLPRRRRRRPLQPQCRRCSGRRAQPTCLTAPCSPLAPLPASLPLATLNPLPPTHPPTHPPTYTLFYNLFLHGRPQSPQAVAAASKVPQPTTHIRPTTHVHTPLPLSLLQLASRSIARLIAATARWHRRPVFAYGTGRVTSSNLLCPHAACAAPPVSWPLTFHAAPFIFCRGHISTLCPFWTAGSHCNAPWQAHWDPTLLQACSCSPPPKLSTPAAPCVNFCFWSWVVGYMQHAGFF